MKEMSESKPRIGVFICHCGVNIAATVDVEEVARRVGKLDTVVVSKEYKYMCSDPGQNIIKDAIIDNGLTGVVVASCSPNLHEITFRNAVAAAGLNPYLFELANIREQCSWVHQDRRTATNKAVKIIRSALEKVKHNKSLVPISIPVTRKCMIIGGGISGMQAALDLANAGIQVVVVEKDPAIGGHMAQLSETFPTLDCSQCILTPRMNEVGHHPNIELLTYSEVVEVEGYVGNFNVKVKKKQRYVDEDKCNGCDKCSEICPVLVPSEFNEGLGSRKAIYLTSPQAVPQAYVLDDKACLGLVPLACGKCKDVCEPGAIDFDPQPEYVDVTVGAIIVATGFDLLSEDYLGEYGHGKYPDVLTSLQFERMLSASGPTGGEIRRPSDGSVPKEIVFIQCAGSRDPEHGKPYCSKVCCMYTAKHALLYKHKVHDGQPYVFYIDIRSGGKEYEEFVQRAIEGEDLIYLRGKVSKVFEEDGKIVVWGADTLTGKKVEIRADLVVLAMAIVPKDDAKDLARLLRISTDEHGFMREAHIKLRPLETLTAGIFLAGAAQAPKDIPDTVSQASGAASKVLTLFSSDDYIRSPVIAVVDEAVCRGCETCAKICNYGAITMDPENKTAVVNEALCEGCGACAMACPSGSIQHKNYTSKQLFEMICVAAEDLDDE
jgi:heterodisulfide reductase subunit A